MYDEVWDPHSNVCGWASRKISQVGDNLYKFILRSTFFVGFLKMFLLISMLLGFAKEK